MVYASPGSGLERIGKKKFCARVDKYQFGARAGKLKLLARAVKGKLGVRAGKYNFRARANKYKLEAKAGVWGRGSRPEPGLKKRTGG